ncbi:FRG domain-containing protein [Sphingobium sp. KCTC 72723]|uniref:FRG domain-containing protein n=1 Tax=Sphingobium sp. KCTC 72723 TaxID=2733867 RepID=UPI00165E9D68|nr:FRG domain-containing protein [Sphingobium sp. KCTC 72723]
MAASEYAAPRPNIVAEINSINDAIEYFDKLKSRKYPLNVFRGHANIDWDVVPSIFRDDMNVLEHESKVIRDLIASYPSEFDQDKSMFDHLVRMQHFGLRTCLMDVSRNPLAALYFAVEDGECNSDDGSVLVSEVPEERIKYYDSDSISCISNLANLSNEEKTTIENTSARTIKELHQLNSIDRLYQFIRSEKPEFRPRIKKEDLFKPYFVYPKMNNKRIVAQSGAFIIFGLNRSKGPDYKKGITVQMAAIPSRSKSKIRDSLKRLGYDDSTLFPDIERSAKQIMKNYAQY